MIAVWMLYCLGIGVAFVIVGHALERGLYLAGRPTRWGWGVALLGSYLIPAVAWLRPEVFTMLPAPVAPAAIASSAMSSTVATIFNQPPAATASLDDLDAPLRWAWIAACAVMLAVLAVATARLIVVRRGWRRSLVDGRDVLISPDVGPAVVGVWSPRVVLPEWTLALPAAERELMLAHEEQHLRARDPLLLVAALGAVLVAPWNLALWWQWRRLRLAVETDCDARVLRQGRSASLYGDLLLRVGERRSVRPLGVAAFGEPVSFLESRLRRMLARLPRWRWARVAAASLVAIGTIAAACEAPRPLSPTIASAQEIRAAMGQAAAQQADRTRPWIRENVRKFLPALADSEGPALDAYLIHDAALQVYQATVTPRGPEEIGATQLRRVFPAYRMGSDAWGMVDRRALEGIVRSNVRIIYVHHDPQPRDTMPTIEVRLQALREQALSHAKAVRLQPNMLTTLEADSQKIRQLNQALEQERWKQRDDALRTLAQQSEPAAFGGAGNAIGLILDSENRLLAHASGTLEPGKESCRDALMRLLPAYANTQFAVSGCQISEKRVVVYWAQLLQH